MIALFIDADAGPVKQEVYRVAERHALKGTALKIFVVSNRPPVPRDVSVLQPLQRSGKLYCETGLVPMMGKRATQLTAHAVIGKHGAETLGLWRSRDRGPAGFFPAHGEGLRVADPRNAQLARLKGERT